jgi:hypothetical protein
MLDSEDPVKRMVKTREASVKRFEGLGAKQPVADIVQHGPCNRKIFRINRLDCSLKSSRVSS